LFFRFLKRPANVITPHGRNRAACQKISYQLTIQATSCNSNYTCYSEIYMEPPVRYSP